MDRRRLLQMGLAAGGLATLPGLKPSLAKASEVGGDLVAFITEGMAKHHIPGLSLAAVSGELTVMAQGFGLADVAAQRPVTVNTAFHMASVSKTVTATAVMMICQDGHFQLDDPVNNYLDFSLVHPAFPDTPITIRHLMTHTAGLIDNIDGLPIEDVGDPKLPLRNLLTGKLTSGGQWYDGGRCFGAEPGTTWKYSNFGVGVLGYLVGRFGPDLRSFSRDRLFAPLGMTHSSWTYADLSAESIATPYWFSEDGLEALPANGYPDWPAGLLRTSANDFARFLALYTGDGLTYLTRQTLQAMFAPSPVSLPPNATFRQGLIWQLTKTGTTRRASHHGGAPGTSTVVAINLDRKAGVLVFANASDNGILPFLDEVVERLFNVTENEKFSSAAG